ncbi:type III restriction-modification system endonuclease [Sporanaerobacter acetigenes]|uniref:type III restriction-modification system endonuclease n=1 Tax=Sporanaerobacter acetigenes TaxID=165813 RepID=UPI00104359FA|nr:DEAD/DEAH box helicase family protein [Sporanaerobacter acetigenes]
MKIKFKEQKFQLEAVQAVVDCFKGQINETSKFTLDRGRTKAALKGQTFFLNEEGFRNKSIVLPDIDVLENIEKVQLRNGLKPSDKLEGKYNLTIEMETGTGKTYTYIRTMYELYRAYGWSKYIIVVPSIAIREGVYKSFQMTEEHFMDLYGTKIRYFIYNSTQLHKIDQFASNSGINVMIINSQAFNARGKDARRIYMELDDFASRRPIDVIAQTNPIVIIDEPQSVEGKKTKEALQLFNPLFTLRYSATHKEDYNKIYRLDALDAYNKKLVKKIKVKGISVKGTTGTNEYIYFEGINLNNKDKPTSKLEFEIKQKSEIKRITRNVDEGFDLYTYSNFMEQYKGYRVAEINGYKNTITFTNGVTLYAGDVQGDVSDINFRRIQIREAIKSHFERERELYNRGIKVLSLFFIDEVAKYRQYDEEGNQVNGIYGKIFEEEYMNILNEYITLFEDPYVRYLKSIDVKETHNGYFSIDKEGRLVDPKTKGKEKLSDDESAYDLIMKDKERLLSFNEPIRFIFSHSALREGWDNPNVFQICTLKHSDSTMRKRQEVGRGLRLCVNQNGERIDGETLGVNVHDINVLTVIASESYETFVRDLQSQIAETLSDRPQKANKEFFLDNVIKNANGEELIIDETLANTIYHSFIRNFYVNEDDTLTEKYYADLENGEIKLPEQFKNFEEGTIQLVGKIYAEGTTPLVEDAREENIKELKTNENFEKKEFKELWEKINVKTAYYVDFDTDELIRNCIIALDKDLKVSDLTYHVKTGEMESISSKEELEKGESFIARESEINKDYFKITTTLRYDLVGKLVDETKLTRKAIVYILKGIKPNTFYLFRKNPEEFILKVAKIINEQKASMIIEHITYNLIDERFDANIFTDNTLKGTLGKDTIEVKKHIYDYVRYDSDTERKFAEALDTSKEVVVYAKLPRGFFIPTPVGNYNPDWAIVFDEGKVRHIYFIAETKGKLESLEFDVRGVERAKIHCAKEHFKKISNGTVKYEAVDSYEMLMKEVMGEIL